MENRKRHRHENKHVTPQQLLPYLLLLSVIASACTEAKPTPDASLWATVQASSRDIATQKAGSRQTLQAKVVTPSPTPMPRRSNPSAPMLCGEVAETNGSIAQALRDANHGVDVPGYNKDNEPYFVSIDHQNPATLANIRYLTTVLQLLNSAPVVGPHDTVCFSSDSYKLKNLMTPTPGPRPSPTPSAYSGNNLRNRSFAVSVNRPAVGRRG